MNAGAYPAVSANTIVLWGRWFAHRSRQGRQSTIQAIPLLAAGQVGSGYPNLVDDVDEAEIKTEPWETTPLIDGALWALPLLPTADQQLGAFGGYELRRGDEPPLIVELLESTGTIPATQEMLDALAQACIQSEATYLDIELGDPIQAVWIGHVANLSTPAPQPPDGFLTTAQTTSLIARYTWRPRGTWSSTTAYEQRDVVKYLGAMWVADAPSTGVTPATGSTWRSVVDKGDPGATGTPGSPGAPGNPGPANSLAIGTVTTGAAGSSAAAQITGTAPSQTLNLTVPRGDKGDGSVSSVDGNTGPNVTLASDGAAGTATKRSLGTGSTQAAAGNDSRITGAAQKAQNLADLPDKAASRTNLGLGSAATYAAADLPVSTATQTALSGKASTAEVTSASTADRARPNHTGQQTSATISDFTEAVQDAVAALLGAGSNITLNYDDAANTLTVSAAGSSGGSGLDAEAVRDAIGVALVGVAPVSVVVNDAADTITISSTATQNSTDAQLRDRSTHTGSLDATVISGVLDDARIPSGIARDAEVADAVASRRRVTNVPDSNGSNDRAAIQAALDAGGEIVFRKGQTWKMPGGLGVYPASNSRIIIEEGAAIEVVPNNLGTYRIFNVGYTGGVSNVTIEGAGELRGDLLGHTSDGSNGGNGGEYGHLINITNGCSDIRVLGPLRLKHAWGDGIYVGGQASSAHILIEDVIVDDVRREGIAVFWASDVTLHRVQVLDVGKTAAQLGYPTGPGSGIDIEPNPSDAVDGIVLDEVVVARAAGCGIYISANSGSVANLRIRNPRIADCGLTANNLTQYQRNGIHLAATSRPIILNPIIRGSGYDNDPHGNSGAIYLRGTTRPVIKGGYLRDNRGRGVFISNALAPELHGVTIQENDRQAITSYQSDDVLIDNCHLLDNVAVQTAVPHVMIQQGARPIARRNVIRGANGSQWLRVYASTVDADVANNLGVGSAPTSGPILDEGAGTLIAGNHTHGSSAVTKWGVDTGYFALSTSGTFTPPLGVSTVRVRAIAPGGQGAGGGSNASAAAQAGGGGGGSAGVYDGTLPVSGALTVTVGTRSVGGTGGAAGGAAGTAGTAPGGVSITGTGVAITVSGGGPGAPSAASSATNVGGGIHGRNATTTTNGIPGSGGQSGQGAGPVTPGVVGGAGGGGATASAGGGGGAAATVSGALSVATPTAGASGTTSGLNGADCDVPGCGGGGGGGGTGGGAGGNGGRGGPALVEFFWTPVG